MVKLSDILDMNNLELMVDVEGMISTSPHPTLPLRVYNYTPRAQYSRTWNNETLTCRGLVADHLGNVVARPFRKFFNASEHQADDLPDLPCEPFVAYEKLDGSLVVVSNYQGHLVINTRGSFQSDQALAATEWWLAHVEPSYRPPEGITLLFEWIAPDNRIVVDYGTERGLALLGAVDNATGADRNPVTDASLRWPYRLVEPFHFDSIEAVRAAEIENAEGFVLRFESGMRVKVKFEEYVRLHAILTNTSTKTIWRALKDGVPYTETLEQVPDEFYAWAEKVTADLNAEYTRVYNEALRDFHRIMNELQAGITEEIDRKAFAAEAQHSDHRALLFRLFDNRSVSDIIWRQIEPKHELPFKESVDA